MWWGIRLCIAVSIFRKPQNTEGQDSRHLILTLLDDFVHLLNSKFRCAFIHPVYSLQLLRKHVFDVGNNLIPKLFRF